MTGPRREIRGGSGLPAERSEPPRIPMRALVEELEDGALCVKCLATHRGFTRFDVERTVSALRREFVLESIIPCRGCGARRSLCLGRPRHPPYLFIIASSPPPSYVTRVSPGAVETDAIDDRRIVDDGADGAATSARAVRSASSAPSRWATAARRSRY